MDIKEYSFGYHTIITKSEDSINVYESRQLFNKKNIINFLCSYIIDIDEVNLKGLKRKIIKNLNADVAKKIINDVYAYYYKFQKIILNNTDDVINIIRFILSAKIDYELLTENEKNIMEYINKYKNNFDFYFDHKANIIHFPLTAGIDEQPFYELEILRMVKYAKIRILNEKGGV